MARPVESGGARRTDYRHGRWNRRARHRRCCGCWLRAGSLAQPVARRDPDGRLLWTRGICPDRLRTAARRRHTARDCPAGAGLADFPHAAGAVARGARVRPRDTNPARDWRRGGVRPWPRAGPHALAPPHAHLTKPSPLTEDFGSRRAHPPGWRTAHGHARRHVDVPAHDDSRRYRGPYPVHRHHATSSRRSSWPRPSRPASSMSRRFTRRPRSSSTSTSRCC